MQVLIPDFVFWEPDVSYEFHIEYYPVTVHLDQIVDNYTHWMARDWEVVHELILAISNGDVLPPLLTDRPRGELIDGYHRSAAYLLTGVTEAGFVSLESHIHPYCGESDGD